MIHTVATSALYCLIPLILAVIKLVCLLVAIAYYTHAERKLMASFQRRSGPNVVGLFGLLQPLADGLKLAGKEFVTPTYSNSRIFIASAMATLMLALVSGTAIPLNLVDASVGLKASTLAELIAPSSEFILKYAQLVREYGKPCWAPAHSYLSGQEFTEATKDVDGGLGQHDWLLFADAFLEHPGFGDDWTPEQRAHGGRCYRVISYNFGREIGSLADETDCFECQL